MPFGKLNIDAPVLDIAGLTKAFNADNATKKAAYSPETVKVGDIIEFYHRPYQHCACMEVVKVNRKTLKCVEINNSYKPGTPWAVEKDYSEIRMSDRKPLTEAELLVRETERKKRGF